MVSAVRFEEKGWVVKTSIWKVRRLANREEVLGNGREEGRLMVKEENG
jgi:hypothetical protein